MIICTTVLLVYVFGIYGRIWDGATAAWMLAALLDFSIYMFLIYSITRKGPNG